MVGWVGGTFMTLYWAGMFYYGYPAYTGVALCVTMAILALTTPLEGGRSEFPQNFLAQLRNNNWVLRTSFGMLLGVIFLWWADPTAPKFELNPVNIVLNWGKELAAQVVPSLEDPLGRISFWATINKFFFGKGVMGWGVLTFHLWATFVAIFVSKWDETIAGLKGTSSSGGLKKIFGQHVVGEVLTQPLEWIWAVLKAPFK